LQGSVVNEQLESRARLPLCVDGTIELTFAVITPADHGDH
jgi:hypothetical protein